MTLTHCKVDSSGVLQEKSRRTDIHKFLFIIFIMIFSVSSTYLKIIIIFTLNSRAQTQNEKMVLKDVKKEDSVLLKISIASHCRRPLFPSLPTPPCICYCPRVQVTITYQSGTLYVPVS
jgi:hypothetical protein